MSARQSFKQSFANAFEGLRYIIAHQRNMRIHLAVAVGTAIIAWCFAFNRFEWIVLVITVTMVLVLEIFNSIIELIVDLLEPRIHGAARIVKDAAAASVLVASIASVLIGILLFWPHLM